MTSTETKQKISIAKKGKKIKPHTKETKLKISLANKGKKIKLHTEEHKLKISLSSKGKPKSEEHKENLRKVWKNPEYRQHMSNVHKKIK